MRNNEPISQDDLDRLFEEYRDANSDFHEVIDLVREERVAMRSIKEAEPSQRENYRLLLLLEEVLQRKVERLLDRYENARAEVRRRKKKS
jgi:hypothetical protein